MENRWNDRGAEAAVKRYADVAEDAALRVYTSRLIGADPALVLHSGGRAKPAAGAPCWAQILFWGTSQENLSQPTPVIPCDSPQHFPILSEN